MKKTRQSIPDKRRAAREAAMPEVQKLVSKYGLTAVSSCVTRLREQARAKANVERAQAELEEMKRKLVR